MSCVNGSQPSSENKNLDVSKFSSYGDRLRQKVFDRLNASEPSTKENNNATETAASSLPPT